MLQSAGILRSELGKIWSLEKTESSIFLLRICNTTTDIIIDIGQDYKTLASKSLFTFPFIKTSYFDQWIYFFLLAKYAKRSRNER